MKHSIKCILLLFSVNCLSQGKLVFPSKPGVTVIHHTKRGDSIEWFDPAKMKGRSTNIQWSEANHLRWNNYRQIDDTIVKRVVGSTVIKGKAGTTGAIKADFYCKGNKFVYDVVALFSPEKSWAIKKDTMQELLRHEQLHFDIFELYARKIRKYLSEYSNPQGMEQQMKKAVNLLIAEQEKVNLQYDTESVHSTNKPMQKKWESKVTEELKKNDAFANTHVVREL